MKNVLKKAFKKVNFMRRTSSSLNNISDSEMIYNCWITNIFNESMKVPGHIIEIGVAKGRNSLLFGSLLKLTGEANHRNYYGFDTFEGYADDCLLDNPWLSSKSWKGNDFALELVEKRMLEQNLSGICRFFKGDCRETLPKYLKSYSDNRIQAGQSIFSLLYIDCNAYLPAIEAIKLIYPHIAPGGIICIDEKRQGGETKALLEFAANNSLTVKHSYYGVPAYLQKKS